MLSRDTLAGWKLVAALRELELLYTRDHAHYPQEMVVITGAALFAALKHASEVLAWRFDPITHELMTSAVRAKVTVVPLHALGMPSWGYRVVPGNPTAGAIVLEEVPDYAG